MKKEDLIARLLSKKRDERAAQFIDPASGGEARVTMWRPWNGAAPRVSVTLHQEPIVVLAPLYRTVLVAPGVMMNASAAMAAHSALAIISDLIERGSDDRLRSFLPRMRSLARDANNEPGDEGRSLFESMSRCAKP